MVLSSGSDEVNSCARAWTLLRRAHDLVARRLTDALERECGLGMSEFDALLALHLHEPEPVRIGGLVHAVSLSQPALSRLVRRLVERGLVHRSEVEDDARATVLCLTDTGKALIVRALGVHSRVVHDAITDRISDADQRALLHLLGRIGSERA
jgi:DNA-binding MarR family transcriptional regulator